MLNKVFTFRGSIVVSISACHAEDPGSIPGRGDLGYGVNATPGLGAFVAHARQVEVSRNHDEP